MTERLGRIRRLTPLIGVVCVAMLVAAGLHAPLEVGPGRGLLHWTTGAWLAGTVAVIHLLHQRSVRRDGAAYVHHPGELLVAFAITTGVAPLLAAAGVTLASSLHDVFAGAGRPRSLRSDWQRRTKFVATGAANVTASIATWAAVSVTATLLPASSTGRPLVLGLVGGTVYGLSGGAILGAVMGWVASGRPRPPRAAVGLLFLPALPQAAAGALLAAIIAELHLLAALAAVIALAPLPAVLRRRLRLEEEHRHAMRLLTLAADSGQDGHGQGTSVATAVAALLHYRSGEVRRTAPVAPREIGTRLADGRWLVLAEPTNLDLADPEDQPRLDALGAVASALLEAGKRRARRQMASQRDDLTGLANRTGLALAVDRFPPDEPVVVVFLDLDDFKPINDRYGHLAGDAVLIEVGRRLSERLRARDVAARLGGDEFLLVMPCTGDDLLAAEIVDRLETAIERPIVLDGGVEVVVRSAVGAASGPARDFDELVNAADAAMYEHKRRRDPSGHAVLEGSGEQPQVRSADPTHGAVGEGAK